jgi:hypothetical protein
MCFFFRECGSLAAIEKQGKFMCSACAEKVPGQSFRLRNRYETSHGTSWRKVADQMDMVEI